MKNNFLLCGLTGWCLEILFTAFDSFRKRELQLTGKTSIWMFPIYGFAFLLYPIFNWIKNKSAFIRGLIYMGLIFLTEYSTGSILKKYGWCPWDYSKSKYNINGLIRIDYAPVWFFCGLFFEYILKKNNQTYE